MKRHRRKRNKFRIWLLVIILLLIALGIAARPTDMFRKYDVAFGIYDLKKEKLKMVPVVSKSQFGDSVENLIDHKRTVAAIAGTYYDKSFKPIGDIVVDGKVLHRGNQRQAVAVKKNGEISFPERKGKAKFNWSGIESAVACGPRLLKNGKVDIDCKRDGFSKSAKTLEAKRCAVGRDKKGRLILCSVRTSVNLHTLAAIMQQLGAVDAINLDGGGSCFFYSKGKYSHTIFVPMGNIITLEKR